MRKSRAFWAENADITRKIGAKWRRRSRTVRARFLHALLRPEIRGGEHGDDFEINEVIPVTHPTSQQVRMRSVHDLETASPAGFHPTGVVGDALREHPAALLEAFANQGGATRLEVFDNHEEHAPQFTPACDHWKIEERNSRGRSPITNRQSQISHNRSPKRKSKRENCQLQIPNRTHRQSTIENRQFLDARWRRELE